MLSKTLIALNMLSLAAIVEAATLTVDLNGGADYTDIQSAIDAAADGDTVLVKPGEYVISEPIDFNRLHDPDNPESPPVKNITLSSEGGAEVTTIRMSGADAEWRSVLLFENGETEKSVLEGLTLSGGTSSGVYCNDSSPTLTDCRISGNSAQWDGGGGVYCSNSSPRLTNCTISGNSAFRGGGGMYCTWDSSPILANCTISGNAASEEGGGVCCDWGSSTTLTGCIVWENLGGSVFIVEEDGSLEISYSCVQGQTVMPGMGNINRDPLFHGWGIASEVWVDPSRVEPGDGTEGSPYSDPGAAMRYSFALTGGSPCLGTGKDGSNMGADTGICEGPPGTVRVVHLAEGTYKSNDLDLSHKVRVHGAGEDKTIISGTVYNLGTGALLSHLTVTGGTKGGGIRIGPGENPEISNCTISGNSGRVEGGGVYCCGSSPTLTNCTITGNWAQSIADTLGRGGGVFCTGGSPLLTNCRISGNLADYGGGVYSDEGSSPKLVNCIISDSCNGGGLHCDGAATLTNCTISGNTASGICGGPALTNCVVWGNVGGSLGGGGDVQFSCIEANEVWPGEGNINVNPLLCGWVGPTDVFVDASNERTGDGTEENPFREISQALGYSLSLQRNSPCIGTGKNGVTMGADTGICEGESAEERVVHVASGHYDLAGLSFLQKASLVGAGQDETVLDGSVWGLRTGAVLSRVTVTGSLLAGIVVRAGDSPRITDCAISGKGNSWSGVWCVGNSSATFTNCTLCRVGCVYGSSPTLADCTITGNSAGGGGSGLFCDGAPTLTNCMISGGVSGGSPRLTNCTILGRVSWFSDGTPTLANCTISGSYIGMDCWDTSTPILTNCTITGYLLTGVNCRGGSSPTLTNCTITGYLSTGVDCGDGSSPTLTNCIVWGNRGDAIRGEDGSTPLVTYSCMKSVDLWPGEGNINSDPLFVQPGQWEDCGVGGPSDCIAYQWDPDTGEPTVWHRWVGDHHLQPGSPCIDAGTSDGAPNTDIEGNTRPCWNGIDIGAYEYCGAIPPFPCGDPIADDDGDGVKNALEDLNGDGDCSKDDTDGDGIPDWRDPDDDGDGVPTAAELIYDDTDSDGIPNYLDADDDGDGVLTRDEDYNHSGDRTDDDANGDGVPDYLDSSVHGPYGLFQRGNANADARIDIADAIFMLTHLFAHGPVPSCKDAGDANDDGTIDIADAIKILAHLFAAAGRLQAPFGACGVDPTEDGLNCESYLPCQ